MMTKQTQEPGDIEGLLPWHAAGTLSRREAARVEDALAQDADLQRQFAIIREELDETIRLNETLGAPSPRAFERLMAGIDAEAAPSRRRGLSFSLGGWLSERMAAMSPRTLAWSAAAAAIALTLQAGLLVGLVLSERGGQATFQTASYTQEPAASQGTYALIAFAPQATAADITKFLEANKVTLVEGPRAGGLYKVRLAVTGLPKEQVAQALRALQEQKGVIRFAAPTE
jgi:hypothetical protein